MARETIPVLIDELQRLTLEEFCEFVQADKHVVVEMVEFGILEPQGKNIARWEFTYIQMERFRKAQRLLNDLHLNLSGVALSLELLDQLKILRQEIQKLEHQLELLGQK